MQFSGATWRITVHNSLRRRLQFSICISSITWEHDVIHKTVSTQRIALSEEDQAVVTGNMYKKFHEFGHATLRYASGETYRCIDCNTLHPLWGWSK